MVIFPHFKDGVPYVGAAGDSLTQLPLHPDVINILRDKVKNNQYTSPKKRSRIWTTVTLSFKKNR
jgi:hypothetical protein